MKNLILFAALLPILFSCSKNKGCNDSSAINYSPKADFDDGSCSYTKLTFYADSLQYPATQLSRIDVDINGVVIGSVTGASYGISDCVNPPDGTLSYSLPSAAIVNWNAVIILIDGSTSSKSGTAQSDVSQPCLVINAL